MAETCSTQREVKALMVYVVQSDGAWPVLAVGGLGTARDQHLFCLLHPPALYAMWRTLPFH